MSRRVEPLSLGNERDMGESVQAASGGQRVDLPREPRHLGDRAKWAWLEVGVLASSCALLLWLNRGDHGAEPLHGAFLAPAWSFAAAVAVTWLVPGYVVCRAAGGPWQGGTPQLLAFSVGAGLAWLTVPAAIALRLGTTLDVLAGTVAGLNTALVAVYAATSLRRPRRRETSEAGRSAPSGGWLVAAAVVVLVHLLGVAGRFPRFTAGSDEWILMRAIRYYLEAKPITYTWDFDVWDLLVALLIRLASVDLVDAWRVYLPPLLIVAASLAFFALAEALFRNRVVASFSYLILAVYALSDMQARGEGGGMGLLVRIVEDKYAACYLVVPLAQAAFIAFLRGGQGALLALSAAVALASVIVYPLSIVWLAFSVGATYAAGLATRRIPARPRVLLALALTLAAATALAWWLRSMRVEPYFRLYDPSWPFGAVLRGNTRKLLLILSREHGWYMASPALLGHPLTIAAVAAALSLLPRFRRSLRAQFLVCSTFVPLLVVYNPLTATLLGGWISPWMVYRVVWIVPVALTLGCALHAALAAVQRRLGPGAAAAPALAGRYALLPLAVVLVMAALLDGRMERSKRALKLRNHVIVSQREKDLMHTLNRDHRLAGRVLAPRGIGIRLPAWTSRLEPSPGLDEFRMYGSPGLAEWAAFYRASSIGDAEVALLKKRNIDYVIAPVDSPLDHALRGLPGPFRSVYAGPSYSLYEWRPERWTAAPKVVTSFDTSARNLEDPGP
jgi:hypothetical protein